MEKKANKRIYIRTAHEEQYRKMKADFVCSINPEIYEAFTSMFSVKYRDLFWWIAKWTKEDFNLDYDFCKANDLRILRELVLDKYATLQPCIFYNDLINTEGWMRVWICDHMGKEMMRYDKREYERLFKPASNSRRRF